MQIPPFWIFYANIEFVFHSIQSKSQSTQSFVLLDDPWTLPLQISKFTYFTVFCSFVPFFRPSFLQSYFCLSRSSGRRRSEGNVLILLFVMYCGMGKQEHTLSLVYDTFITRKPSAGTKGALEEEEQGKEGGWDKFRK